MDVLMKKLTEHIVLPDDYDGSGREYLASLQPTDKVPSSRARTSSVSEVSLQVTVVMEKKLSHHGLCGKASNRTLTSQREAFKQFVVNNRIPAPRGYNLSVPEVPRTENVSNRVPRLGPEACVLPASPLEDVEHPLHGLSPCATGGDLRRSIQTVHRLASRSAGSRCLLLLSPLEQGLRGVGRRTPSEWLKELFGPNSTRQINKGDGTFTLLSEYTVLYPRKGPLA
jgi:hypothetical protein